MASKWSTARLALENGFPKVTLLAASNSASTINVTIDESCLARSVAALACKSSMRRSTGPKTLPLLNSHPS